MAPEVANELPYGFKVIVKINRQISGRSGSSSFSWFAMIEISTFIRIPDWSKNTSRIRRSSDQKCSSMPQWAWKSEIFWRGPSKSIRGKGWIGRKLFLIPCLLKIKQDSLNSSFPKCKNSFCNSDKTFLALCRKQTLKNRIFNFWSRSTTSNVGKLNLFWINWFCPWKNCQESHSKTSFT